MKSVALKAEPATFDTNVRQKGNAFVNGRAALTPEEWKSGEKIWQSALDDMMLLYDHCCCYSCINLKKFDGRSVDHFISRKADITQAYEWHNFRLCSVKANRNKGVHAVIDPFLVQLGMFEIDFSVDTVSNRPLVTIVCGTNYVGSPEEPLIRDSIKYLKLNEEEHYLDNRRGFFESYLDGAIRIDLLTDMFPFLGAEITRQGL